jgi:ankyrin repeat protein
MHQNVHKAGIVLDGITFERTRQNPIALSSTSMAGPITSVEFAVSLLLRTGMCPEAEIEKTNTVEVEPQEDLDLLVQATKANDLKRLRSLFRSGNSLAYRNQYNESLIHIACRADHLDILCFLLKEAQLSLSVRDLQGRTPLHIACQVLEPNFGILELLIQERQEHMCLPDNHGRTPLEYLSQSCWREFLGFLSERPDLIRAD